MSKLIKYEFRKTWITKAILLGVTAAVMLLLEYLLIANMYEKHDGE